MFQLFFIGIILYALLFLLAKARVFNGLTRILAVVNTVIVVGFTLFVLVKTGLLRSIAAFLSFLLIRLSEFMELIF
ncbi:hypothetical protein [Ureibacillus chungkukjangi]|uniref:Uncharacterized protein n=1 Tax=Ureibacillus chungkukjangi TaxID=1202712 RepID=A0A318U4F8_9BACL|nr:hypothetical protein [Ureibacillus chungkukjangi]PYF06799.1 hypothetical protein BJ095_10733 [Ureibacillus chungkukjangi]